MHDELGTREDEGGAAGTHEGVEGTAVGDEAPLHLLILLWLRKMQFAK